ncbi:MAG TPA: type IV toxin-antitoxin system AbiEi family antitoxin domain-containing protein [Thermoleophilaceae bacterium]
MARRQHGVITWQQLLRLGFTPDAIRHRVAIGRLFRVFRGVYALGRAELTPEGWWMAGVLACGERAALSHDSAASHYGILRTKLLRPVHVSVPAVGRRHERTGLVLHRRRAVEITRHRGIPITTPECTIVDLAPSRSRDELEGMINDADIRGLTDPERLRAALDEMPAVTGKQRLRRILDMRTFRFTRSRLERAFIPIALRAGLPRPLTAQVVEGYEVDFYWPELKLVVETDGLTYHRTPQQQAADLERDQRLAAVGFVPLRFSHGQIRWEPERVEAVLADVARRLRAAAY